MERTAIHPGATARRKRLAPLPRRAERILYIGTANRRIDFAAREYHSGILLCRAKTHPPRKPVGCHHFGTSSQDCRRIWRNRIPNPLPARCQRNYTIRKNRLFPTAPRATLTGGKTVAQPTVRQTHSSRITTSFPPENDSPLFAISQREAILRYDKNLKNNRFL